MEKIVLDHISVNKNLVEYHYTVSSGMKKYFTTDCMFLQYEENMSEVPMSILTIPFVNCMAGLSWLSNCVLFVDEIDATYYESFKSLKVAYNELHNYIGLKGLLTPSKIIKNELDSIAEKGILLFGGGVDCHSTFIRNKESISHILNIYGWLKNTREVNQVDIHDKEQTASYARTMGVESLHARSNFVSQFSLSAIDKDFNTSYWFGFLHSMAFLSIAAPLAWVYKIKNLFIASSFTKGKVGAKCASDITTDSLFKFANYGRTIHDGFELNRQEKIKILVEYQRSICRPYPIQACSFNDSNCCECEKCFRTIIELIAENANINDFGFNIDGDVLNHWKRIIERDIALWGPSYEVFYYEQTKQRMLENYDAIREKSFVDWFLSLDFMELKKKALKRYYCQNFFSILKRKLGIK